MTDYTINWAEVRDMRQSEKSIVSAKATEYICNVFHKQGRVVGLEELYQGYISVFKPENQLTYEGFTIAFDVVAEIVGKKRCPNANCKYGAVSKPNVGMVMCEICNGQAVIDIEKKA
ncbi:hypothetical protein LCGC14_2030870 [marine sediment metagenome]|uniref:Uncharacterized protein n=1 Tax=marine sediment metagenome TaxID=412755 RepID=A0A0F9HRU4_9ZZZZ